MNYENFTIKTQEALQEASSIANKNDNSEIGTEHVLQALLEQQDGLIDPVVERVGVPSIELRKSVTLLQLIQRFLVHHRFIFRLQCKKFLQKLRTK